MVLIPPGFRESLVFFNSRDLITNFDIDVVPTDNNDVIGGHTLADVLFGLGGNDRIVGNGGADILAGDDGNDTLTGSGGRDTLLGGNGNDRLDGGAGRDSILGEAGDDLLFGRGGNDEFDGGEGDDAIRGNGGFDQAHYNSDILTADGEFNFDFVRAGTSIGTITDTNTADGDLGTDLLISIEKLKFADLEVFLDGTNNPFIAFDDAVETDEDNSVTFNVLDNDVDFDVDFLGLVDDDDIVSVDDTGLMGTLDVDFETGEITYDPGDAFQFLALGESATETFSYVATDSSGTTSEAEVEVTILGVNDRPETQNIVITTDENTESITTFLSGFSSDIDATDILSWELFGPEELQGLVSFDPTTGVFEFDLNDNYQFLNDGETETIVFSYVAIDDSGADNDTSIPSTITINIEGETDPDIVMTEMLEFDSNDQSTFGSGDAQSFEPDLPFIGFEFDSGSTTQIFGGIDLLVVEIPSIQLVSGISGQIGFQPIFSINAGDIDTALDATLEVTVPDQIEEGQEITIGSRFRLDDGSVFDTTSPGITLALDFIFDLAATLRIITDNNPNSGFSLIPGGDIDIDQTINLFTLTNGSSLTVPLPGDSSITGEIPQIDTVSTFNANTALFGDEFLSSSGEDRILDIDGDIDGLITSFFGLPGILENSLSIPLIPGLVDFVFSYNLLDFTLSGDAVNGLISLAQEFEISVGDVELEFTLEDGSMFNVTAGDDLTFTVPDGADINEDGIVDFNVDVNINGDPLNDAIGARLDTSTFLNFDLDFTISALEASFSLDVPVADDIELAGFGPLFSQTFDIIEGDDFVTLFEDEFALTGFNNDDADFMIDISNFVPTGLDLPMV